MRILWGGVELQLEDLMEVEVRDVERVPFEVEGQSTRVVEHRLELPPVGPVGDGELGLEAPGCIEELNPVVAGVGHGDERSIRRNSQSPREGELSTSVTLGSEGEEVVATRIQDLDAMVVLVSDEDSVRVGIVGEGGWTEEFSRSRSTSSHIRDEPMRTVAAPVARSRCSCQTAGVSS